MPYRDFILNPNFSGPLNDLLLKFIDRLDMSTRDREIFEELLMFAYAEGKIKGQEEFLDERHRFLSTENETNTSDNAETKNTD